MKRCLKCGCQFQPEWVGDDDNGFLQDKLCYHCFEEGVEEAHFARLERIARENEF